MSKQIIKKRMSKLMKSSYKTFSASAHFQTETNSDLLLMLVTLITCLLVHVTC